MRTSGIRFFIGSAAFTLGFSLLSCADDPSGPGEPIPASMVVVSGSGQTGMVGTELAQPLVVEVRDGSNNPLPGIVVNFVVAKGNGTVFAGAAETDNNGRAYDYWRLGTSTADSQRVEVRSVSSTSGAKEVHASFIATPTPGPVASVAIPVDTIRLNWVGDTARIPATALDQYGNPIPTAPLRYRVLGDGVTAVDSMTGVLTAQSLGVRRLRAYIGTISDTARAVVAPVVANLEPAAETLTVNSLNRLVPVGVIAYDSGGTPIAQPGALRYRSLNTGIVTVPDSLTNGVTSIGVGVGRIEVLALATGTIDTARVRVRQVIATVAVSPPTNILPIGDSIQLSAIVLDSNAVAIPNTAVTWSSDDTTRVRVSQLGRAYGVGYGATSIRAAAQSAPGRNGSGLVTVRNADTLAVVLHNGNGQADVVAQPLDVPLAVRVVNQFGEGIPDVPVVWWSPDGPAVAPWAPQTDPNGFAFAAVTLDTVAGIKRAYATIGHDTVPFGFVARPDVPASFTRNSPVAQVDTAGDIVVAPRVRVQDRYGNGIAGLQVNFLPRSGSTVTGNPQITAADGRATVTTWQVDSIPGADTLFAVLRDTVDTAFPRLRFTVDVVPDSGSYQRSLLAAADTVRERDSTIVQVQLRDRFGNPLTTADGTVTFHAGFGSFDPTVSSNDGWYRAVFRPLGARGGTTIRALLDGDSIWALEPITSRSYLLRWNGHSTDYFAAANWSIPSGALQAGPPSTLDSLYLPAGLPNYPLLVQNMTVENVFIEQGATLNVGTFDLTVTRSFMTASLIGGTGLSGTGRLIMTGFGTINGDMRHLRILEAGRTSLEGNINVTGGRIVVQGGRLRNQGYRIRVRPN